MIAADRVTALESELATLTAAETARRVWDAATAARGARPTVPTLGTAPTPPTAPKPSTTRDELEAVIRAHDDATRDRAGAIRRRDEARRQVDAATTTHAAAQAEADRVVALVSAVRDGPSELLRRQLAHLGDTGRACLSVEDGELCVMVESAHGIMVSADVASRGEVLAAGYDLRVAVRRAVTEHVTPAAKAVPIIVDNRQDYSGGLADAAPVISLSTAPVDGLTVGGAS